MRHTVTSDRKSLIAAWAIATPEAVARGPQVHDSGLREIRGNDTWVYLRLTREAAKALASQLLLAAEHPEDPEVIFGHPQGAFSDEVEDVGSGVFLHPLSSSLTIRIFDMPSVDDLVAQEVDPKPMTPIPNVDCHFPEFK
jgi:hypothetical protein